MATQERNESNENQAADLAAAPTPARRPSGKNGVPPTAKPLLDRLRAEERFDKPFTFFITAKIAAGKEREALEAFRQAYAGTHQEIKRCLAYEFHQDSDDPSVFVIFEKWPDGASLDAHFQQPHTLELLATLEEVVAEPISLRLCAPVEGAWPAPQK
jgi:quinol monooxygenase YgiN